MQRYYDDRVGLMPSRELDGRFRTNTKTGEMLFGWPAICDNFDHENGCRCLLAKRPVDKPSLN